MEPSFSFVHFFLVFSSYCFVCICIHSWIQSFSAYYPMNGWGRFLLGPLVCGSESHNSLKVTLSVDGCCIFCCWWGKKEISFPPWYWHPWSIYFHILCVFMFKLLLEAYSRAFLLIYSVNICFLIEVFWPLKFNVIN